mmetsp:Transcript_4450/g.7592  ORF Transcript_4450/g.7592 Transcript_4450/m.7592 type:complete len:349 (+) Transcript_4450:618-1664(+)
MEGVRRSSNRSLPAVLQAHVVVVVGVTGALGVPAAAVLELSGDLVHEPVLADPLERGDSVAGVDLEDVEGGRGSTDDGGEGLPEPDPLGNLSVFIDHLAQLEVERRIRVHRGRLHEGLELVAGVSLGSLESQDSLEGALAELGVAESRGHVRELLVVGPLDIVLRALIMVVVVGGGLPLPLNLELLFEEIHDIRGLAEGMVVSVEHVADRVVVLFEGIYGEHVGRHILLVIQVSGPDLGDVKVDHHAVEGVDLSHLLGSEGLCIHVILNIDTTVGYDDIGSAVGVAGGIEVVDLDVLVLLVLVEIKVHALFGDHLFQGQARHGGLLLLRNLLLEIVQPQLVVQELLDH